MQDLITHLIKPVVAHPDDVSINTIEGESVTMLELTLNPADHALFEGDNENNLRAVRSIISAAAGSKKATLEIVSEGDAAADEE